MKGGGEKRKHITALAGVKAAACEENEIKGQQTTSCKFLLIGGREKGEKRIQSLTAARDN